MKLERKGKKFLKINSSEKPIELTKNAEQFQKNLKIF